MPSLPARVLLFLSSYAPLWVMFVLLFWSKSPAVAYVSGVSAIIGIVGIWLYFRVVNQMDAVSTNIVDCHDRSDQATSYMVSYIIPFLSVAFSDWQQAAALVVFFIILGFLYVNSDMIHINPTLNLLMYRLYEVTLDNGSTYSLVARRRIHKGETLRLIRIGDDILLEKKGKSHG